jgi:hypothetical protein
MRLLVYDGFTAPVHGCRIYKGLSVMVSHFTFRFPSAYSSVSVKARPVVQERSGHYAGLMMGTHGKAGNIPGVVVPNQWLMGYYHRQPLAEIKAVRDRLKTLRPGTYWAKAISKSLPQKLPSFLLLSHLVTDVLIPHTEEKMSLMCAEATFNFGPHEPGVSAMAQLKPEAITHLHLFAASGKPLQPHGTHFIRARSYLSKQTTAQNGDHFSMMVDDAPDAQLLATRVLERLNQLS